MSLRQEAKLNINGEETEGLLFNQEGSGLFAYGTDEKDTRLFKHIDLNYTSEEISLCEYGLICYKRFSKEILIYPYPLSLSKTGGYQVIYVSGDTINRLEV